MAYEVFLVSADGRVEDALDSYDTQSQAIQAAQRQNVAKWAHNTPGVLRKRVEVWQTRRGERVGKSLWTSQYVNS